MPLPDAIEDDLLELMFLNLDAPNFGDAAGLQNSAAEGFIQISANTVAFGDADTLLTDDECNYIGYNRVTDSGRNASNWTVTSGTVSNDTAEQFDEKTSGADDTIVAFGLGFIATGNVLQYYGTTNSLVVSDGINPQFAAGALDISVT